MNAGAILTLGLGTFSDVNHVVTLGFGVAAPSPIPSSPEISAGGARDPKKKVRGPYSDPRIYEQYIERCIAEREAPRVSTETAVLKEALVSEVEERRQTGYEERDALLKENQILERLVAIETAKRDLRAIQARQRQIVKQIEELEDEEASIVLALFNALED